MTFMVSTTSLTTAPPWMATSARGFLANWFACWALSALCATVELSSSMDAAVSSSALACCSVRAKGRCCPAILCVAAAATLSAFWRTRVTTCDRLAAPASP